MALHYQTLKTRAITALIFAVLMLSGLLYHAYGFILLFVFIALGATVEFYFMIQKIAPQKMFPAILWAIPYIFLPFFLLIDLGFYPNTHFPYFKGKNLAQSYSALMPCAIIFSIWINDTMAYLVGSLIGKTPFSPISPKKTWEGTIGGALLCVGLIGWMGSTLSIAETLAPKHWVMIALIAAVMGTLGDLLESKLKRMAQIKDSGSIMPGHGGFLDRFDSLLLATPAVWIYVKLFCAA